MLALGVYCKRKFCKVKYQDDPNKLIDKFELFRKTPLVRAYAISYVSNKTKGVQRSVTLPFLHFNACIAAELGVINFVSIVYSQSYIL